MGRLGGGELGYGSDADVLFVCEPARAPTSTTPCEFANQVAENVRRRLGSPSPDPALVVDADLRPEGRNGPLVRTLESYRGRPQQRLRLPGLRPARVVGPVGLQRAHQRPVAALGAQVGVDEQRRVRARRAETAPDGLGHLVRVAHGVLLARRRARARRRRARRRRCRSPARPRRAGPCRSRPTARVARRRRSPAPAAPTPAWPRAPRPTPRTARRTPRASTARRAGPHTRRAAARAGAASGPSPRPLRARTGAPPCAAARRQRPPGRAAARRRGPPSARRAAAAPPARARAGPAPAPTCPAAASAAARPAPRRAAAAGTTVCRPVLGHPPVGQQAAVGIGAAGELVEQHGQQGLLDRRGARDPAGQRAQVPQRALRRRPTQRAEPRGGLLLRQPRGVDRQPRHRGEQRAVEQLLVQPPHPAGVAASTPP